jgi:hypothetical protein
MADYPFSRDANTINTEALDAYLTDTYPAFYASLSTGPYGVIIHTTQDLTANQIAVLQQIIDDHDSAVLSAAQQQAAHDAAVKAGAITQASAIPSFAHWTEQDGLDWIDANIGNGEIAAVANLADAKALMTKQAVAFRALWRLAVALRNETWPNLEN